MLALILGLNPPGPAVGGALPEPGGDFALIQVFRPASMEFRGGDAPLFPAGRPLYQGAQENDMATSAPPRLSNHVPFLYNGGT